MLNNNGHVYNIVTMIMMAIYCGDYNDDDDVDEND